MQHFENFLIFDITELKDTVIGKPFGIKAEIVVNDVRRKIRRIQEPLLVLYENLQSNPLLNRSLVRTKRENDESDLPDYVEEYEWVPEWDGGLTENDVYRCRKSPWRIEFSWFQYDWLLFPTGFNASICSGRCSFPLIGPLNSTYYSLFKNIYHFYTDYIYTSVVPQACCTPISYSSLSILYITQDETPVVRQLPKARVANCGCR